MLNLTRLCTKASESFPGTLIETLLNLTFSGNFLRNPVEPDLALHQNLPNLLRIPVECDLSLHQTLPDLLRNLFWNLLRNPVELGFAPMLPGTFSGSPESCWTRPYQACLCTKASQTFSGTFGTFFGTWSDPAPAPVNTGAILGWRPH